MTVVQIVGALGRQRVGGIVPVHTTAATWGFNSHSQGGTGWRNGNILSPLGSVLKNLSMMVNGYYCTVALMPDGTMRSWGGNSLGQLCNGKKVLSQLPSRVMNTPTEGLGNVEAITMSGAGGMLLLKDKTIRTWGSNGKGCLGNGEGEEFGENTGPSGYYPYKPKIKMASDVEGPTSGGGVPRLRPAVFEDITNVQAIASGNSFRMVLLTNGKILTWGFNTGGECGIGSTLGSRGKQGTAGAPYEYEDENPGFVFKYKEKGSGTYEVFTNQIRVGGKKTSAWVAESGGGPEQQYAVPVLENAIYKGNAIAVAGGESHALALLNDLRGTVASWGTNKHGELGIGSITLNSTVPVEVKGLPTKAEVEANPGKKVVAISAGGFASMAMLKNGEVYSWGAAPQLGTGSEVSVSLPEKIPLFTTLKPASWINVGKYNSTALSLGKVYVWGSNSSGQLGNKEIENRASYEVGKIAGVDWVAFQALEAGPEGNNLGIELLGGISQTLGSSVRTEIVEGVEKKIGVIQLATDATGAVTCTYKEMIEMTRLVTDPVGQLINVFAAFGDQKTHNTEATGIAIPFSTQFLKGGSGSIAYLPLEVPLPSAAIGTTLNELHGNAVLAGINPPILLTYAFPADRSTLELTWEWPPENTSSGWNIIWERNLSGEEKTQLLKEEAEGKITKTERKSIEAARKASWPQYKVTVGTPPTQSAAHKELSETCPQTYTIGAGFEKYGAFELDPVTKEPYFYKITIRNSVIGNAWDDLTIELGPAEEEEPA